MSESGSHGIPALKCGEPHQFEGYVDDFESPLRAMEFSLDGGEHWTRYPMPDTHAQRGIHWSFSYTPEKAGFYILKARAVNEQGIPSPVTETFAFEVRE